MTNVYEVISCSVLEADMHILFQWASEKHENEREWERERNVGTGTEVRNFTYIYIYILSKKGIVILTSHFVI